VDGGCDKGILGGFVEKDKEKRNKGGGLTL